MGNDMAGIGDTGSGHTSGELGAVPGYAPSQGSVVQLGDNTHVNDIVAGARGRSDGFAYGDDRVIGDRPNWMAHDSEQLYQFATQNNIPGSAEELGQTWGTHSRNLSRAAEDLYNAISELGSAWIGQGSGAAQGALVGIANSSSQASEAADSMSQRLVQQAAAAAELKKMPHPEEFRPGDATAAMLAGGPAMMTKDMKKAFDNARETKAEQVKYLETYTAALSDVDSATPSFGPHSLGLPGNGSTINANAATHVSSASGFSAPGGGAGGPGFGGVAGGPGFGVHGGEAAAPHAGPGAAGHAPAAQGPGAQAPAPGTTVSGGGQAAPQAPAASSGPGAAPALGAAAGGAALGFAGARSLSSGNRTAASKTSESQAEEGATTASSEQGNSAASVQPQNQGMVSPGGTIGAQQQAAGAPMGGAPMGGGAGAQASEEEEHKHASFLIEADPDDAFGANVATAPPVLGMWDDEDDEER